jgi:hypothetical protein
LPIYTFDYLHSFSNLYQIPYYLSVNQLTTMSTALVLVIAAILAMGAFVPHLSLVSQVAFADDNNHGNGDDNNHGNGDDDHKKHYGGDDHKKHHGDDDHKKRHHDNHNDDSGGASSAAAAAAGKAAATAATAGVA